MSIEPVALPLTQTLSESKRHGDEKTEFVDVGLKKVTTRGSSVERENSFEENQGGENGSSMTRAKWLACAALALSYSTSFQQNACTATIVKHIDAALGPTTYYNWILSGHNITVTLMLPLAGGLSDVFGRKWFVIGGSLFSLSGVIVALAARDIPTMIAAMVLKGIGSGAQQIGLAAIAEIVPNKHRGTAQAALDLVNMPWTLFGAMIGNSMVKRYALSFRINFIIGILLNLMTIVMTYFCYHPPPGNLLPGQTRLQAFRELDWAGVALYGIGMVLTLMGIAFGGDTFPWRSAGVIIPIVLGLLSFVALGFWEWKGASNPFFARELFRGRSSRFAILLVIAFVGGMSSFTAYAFWTEQSQAMFFSDPDQIGLSSLPIGFGGVIGGGIVGILIGKSRFCTAKYMLLFGTVLKIFTDIMYIFVTPSRLVLALFAGFISNFGMGIVLVGVVVCVQLTCQDSHIGLATLVVGSIRSMGGSVAIIAYSSILQNTIKKEMVPRVEKAVAGLDVPKSTIPKLAGLLVGNREKDAARLPGVTEAVMKAAEQAIKWAWSVAYQHIYFAAIAFTCLGFVLAFFVPDVSEGLTDSVAITLANDTAEKSKRGDVANHPV
ncbi:hypothetical protein EG327_007039 [Venturia inaequalis]|uniref:Major facilitator superfamily (MFS) profile domain-containing protein n=1 Tax=Venturia inaequalis TaxID=5025 RepID=A0A8H3Z3J2_VENIN|nr:hypothetical protein EG327_007039 [Venturia inaequalis]